MPSPTFDNSYARLPEQFHSHQLPTPVPAPQLIRYNGALAQELGIDEAWLTSAEALQVLAGNRIATGSEPIATVYAGHQFGGWNPRLGDGRAILLGEVIGRDGRRRDIQLKGAGRTPYSRGGDGRSPLGPVLREYIVSEAMAALNVPTTRSLAAVATGDTVYREQALPGGILTRVAASHIRIGTVQYFWAREETAAVQLLADYVIDRHYPEARRPEARAPEARAPEARAPEARATDNPYLALLQGVVARQATLIAQWMALGFIHGVMNTDNMLLSGETIDYGPCAFIDDFHPQTVFSSIDTRGRYAYANQPGIAQWNLAWLAQALVPLIDTDEERAVAAAQQCISDFKTLFDAAHERALHDKLGFSRIDDDSRALVGELFELMASERADFTLTFRRLAELADTALAPTESSAAIYPLPAGFAPWLSRWQARHAAEPTAPAERQRAMLQVNPVFIPRNHLVEEAIRAAVDEEDYQPFHRLVDRLAEPCRYDPAAARYATPPRPEQVVAKTFCGT